MISFKDHWSMKKLTPVIPEWLLKDKVMIRPSQLGLERTDGEPIEALIVQVNANQRTFTVSIEGGEGGYVVGY